MTLGEVLLSVKRQFDIFSHILLRGGVTADGYTRVSVSWPDEDLLERAKAAAASEERSLSQWIVRTVRAHLAATETADRSQDGRQVNSSQRVEPPLGHQAASRKKVDAAFEKGVLGAVADVHAARKKRGKPTEQPAFGPA